MLWTSLSKTKAQQHQSSHSIGAYTDPQMKKNIQNHNRAAMLQMKFSNVMTENKWLKTSKPIFLKSF